eukprot:CAMPEP_0119489202 /NCGR_PEP_ID=MMETSP1344-20130328/14732_1 /TAXON_ID=236787 /ORGANISM="Florenciella parvula, Strain CCMP2471" /LENGTH=48 /DNA_ID= /DNA_START= /DNA_END= /DNA_ORIENTATION=
MTEERKRRSGRVGQWAVPVVLYMYAQTILGRLWIGFLGVWGMSTRKLG